MSYLAFGWFIDRRGTRIGYAVSIAAWSLAAAAHALVNSVGGFAIAGSRSGGGGWEFSRGDQGGGPVVSPQGARPGDHLVQFRGECRRLAGSGDIPPLAMAIGWHGIFLLAGAAGFVWLAFWLRWFDIPSRAKGVGEAERAFIVADGDIGTSVRPVAWRQILRYRQTWGYLITRALTDPVWWFFLIWLPDYFKTSRGLDFKKMGLPLVVIYALVTVLSVAGGGWPSAWWKMAGASRGRGGFAC